MQCASWSETKDQFGNPIRYPCSRVAVAIANYLDNRGKPKVHAICKMHQNALTKRYNRLLKKTGWDAQLKFEPINHGNSSEKS